VSDVRRGAVPVDDDASALLAEHGRRQSDVQLFDAVAAIDAGRHRRGGAGSAHRPVPAATAVGVVRVRCGRLVHRVVDGCSVPLLERATAESKPYNVDPILQLGNLEVQRVAR